MEAPSCFDSTSLPGCNSCKEPSPAGGCNDPYCEIRICESLNQTTCCDEAWSENCTALAAAVCFPEVLPVPPGEYCPSGFVCDENGHMSNCSEIRQIPIIASFGDVFGGTYCPKGEKNLKNCPVGYYCGTPEDRKMCPEGEFCSHKSLEPWIDCGRCAAGSTGLKRDAFGYLLFGIGSFLLLLAIGFSCLRSYKKEAFDKQVELLARKAGRMSLSMNRKRIKKQVDSVRPHLEIINKRLSNLESTSSSIKLDGKSQFSIAPRLYDILDIDKNELSYDELNAVLQLNEQELNLFVKRMQELSGNDQNQTTISRRCFVQYFLQVLEENVHFTITQDEAEAIYNEILEENRTDTVDESMLYASSISNYLSDIQIYLLVKTLRLTQSRQEVSSQKRRSSGLLRPGLLSQRMQRSSFRLHTPNEKSQRSKAVDRQTFIEQYPIFLARVMTSSDDLEMSERDNQSPGIDICFKNLSLTVKVANEPINVVDNVTGRVRAKTMTALMGGSGAGKTSLLNALCGRAYYGEVSGETYINGQRKDIEVIKESIGFVPQDDIVYAELTVRENFIYAGKFRLPKGTPNEEIEDLADETLANLGLVRVANSLVGDVKRRGVSGGEKKRVNIGLELMARPSCLFLDEPTSGLDSSSALLVMSAMKHLVSVQGVTIVSVIHQPRKFIYDLFDSLILLGVGGRMVYHGPTDQAFDYCANLGYVLPPGESVADWLIDISTGRIAAGALLNKDNLEMFRFIDASNTNDDKIEGTQIALNADTMEEMERGPLLAPSADLATGENRVDTGKSDNASEEAKVRRALKRARKKKKKHKKNQEGTKAALNANTMEEMECGPLLAPSADFVTGKNGVSAEKSDNAFEEAKVRRVLLYAKWTVHFESLNAEAREKYEVPPSTELPETKKKKQFISQLYNQVMRAFLVSRRNITSRLIDTAILIGATVVITVSSGLPELTRGLDPQVSFEELVLPTEDSLKGTMQQLFAYALTRQFDFPLKVGIIMCVLIGLMATRILTDKKIEFFREASSGYNMNAYFVAVNIVATIEHSIQILCLTFFAAWLREPVAHWSSYFAHFLALGWICVSWSLFFPMIIPPDNVVVVTGFFMAFCGLLLSGAFPPTTWKVIYEGGIKELVSGWFSPTRYFFEALTVGEYRCLPPQSGWTVDDESVSFPRDATLMSAFGIAGHDPNATRPSCSGWYWGILPSIFVGLTVRYAAWLAMHTFHRAKQTKKPIIFEIKRDVRMCVVVFFLLVILVSLGVLTTWLFTRDLEPEYEELDFSALPIENLKKDGYGYVNEVLAATNTSSVFSLNSNSFTFPGN